MLKFCLPFSALNWFPELLNIVIGLENDAGEFDDKKNLEFEGWKFGWGISWGTVSKGKYAVCTLPVLFEVNAWCWNTSWVGKCNFWVGNPSGWGVIGNSGLILCIQTGWWDIVFSSSYKIRFIDGHCTLAYYKLSFI